MIQSTQEFEITREQLGKAELALASLREDVLPKSEAQYRLMAEAYIDMILKLRAEIDEYLGLASEPRLSG